jgi:hypothetical protein
LNCATGSSAYLKERYSFAQANPGIVDQWHLYGLKTEGERPQSEFWDTFLFSRGHRKPTDKWVSVFKN